MATAIGLTVIGVPFVIALAVIEFVASFVPIVGALLSGALAAVVALVTGGVTDALLVVALAIAIDQVEGHFFQPVVIGRAIKLHAIVVIVALTAGTLVAGLAGAIFSVPLTGMVVATIGEFRVIRSEQDDYGCETVPVGAKYAVGKASD